MKLPVPDLDQMDAPALKRLLQELEAERRQMKAEHEQASAELQELRAERQQLEHEVAATQAILAVAVKLVVACGCNQAARLGESSQAAMPAKSLFGFRCTASIRDQFRMVPDQRCGWRWRAAS